MFHKQEQYILVFLLITQAIKKNLKLKKSVTRGQSRNYTFQYIMLGIARLRNDERFQRK